MLGNITVKHGYKYLYVIGKEAVTSYTVNK